jgi:hypothetical protein
MIKVWFPERLSEQDAVGHVLDDGLVGGAVLEANGVADLESIIYITYILYIHII